MLENESAFGGSTATYMVTLFAAAVFYCIVSDHEGAMRLLRCPVESEYAAAQCNLGLMYANGESVVQNKAEAVRLYRLAAEQGDAVAQRLLGKMYRTRRSSGRQTGGGATVFSRCRARRSRGSVRSWHNVYSWGWGP